MTANDIFQKLQQFATKIFRVFFVLKSNILHKKQLKNYGYKIKRLSAQQKKEVDAIFEGVGKYDYKTHELYYTVTGRFEPLIVPEMLFRTKIEMALNKGDFKYAWDDKTYTDMFFSNLPMPKLILRNISGTFYDKNFNALTYNEVVYYLNTLEQFVIKKSYDSGVGVGVLLVKTKTDSVVEILEKYRNDYIIQEVFRQNKLLSEFNETSVNVIRYNSLLLNGKVIPLNASLRIGAKGAFNDNSIQPDGKGMIVIGIDKNGCLNNEAYYACGVSATSDMDIQHFQGLKIPGYEEMTNIILETHKKMGYFGFIGWDFIVDENGHAAVMEYNLNGAGVLYYQYTNGPLFGEYTKQVLEYCKNKK